MVRKYINTDDLIAYYESGMPCQEIANIFGCCWATLRRRLDKLGIPDRRRITIDTDEVISLFQSDMSVKAISKKLGCDTGFVRRTLTKHGIATRTRSEAMFLRMSKTTEEERIRLTTNAHNAVRGSKRSFEDLCKRSKGVERTLPNVSRTEVILKNWIEERGFSITQQKSVGIYNIDIAFNKFPIAVEVYAAGWHASGSRIASHEERTKYLLDSGYTVIIVAVDARRHPLEIGAVEYIIAIIQQMSSSKSPISKYHVIWGNGDTCTRFKIDFENTAIIP